MATIPKNQGDSITIHVTTDDTITLSDINEMVIFCGIELSAKLSLGQITQVDNLFVWKIPSEDTRLLRGVKDVTVGVDLDGTGVRKAFSATSPKIDFKNNNNAFNNSAVSDDFVDLIIELGIVSGTVTVSETLFNAYFNTSFPKVIQVAGLGNGDNIRHNLHSNVFGQFITDGQIQAGFYLEYVDDNNSVIRVPGLEGLFASFTGDIILTALVNYSSKTQIIKLPDDIAFIEDGSIIPHTLDGDVFLQFIQDNQVQAGYYGNNNTGDTITFRTPELEDNNDETYETGYLICTKLN